jgi:hypothetical protein
MPDPFRQVDGLTIEVVDAIAGARKTLTMIAVSLERARQGVKTLFAVPTLALAEELVAFAQRSSDVPVIMISSREKEGDYHRRNHTVAGLIRRHVSERNDGHVLFITHEALYRMGTDWPERTHEYELVIDEAPEVVLTRQPFRLYDSSWVLTSFLAIEPISIPPAARRARRRAQAQARAVGATEFTVRDARLMAIMEVIIAKGERGSSAGEVARAKEQLDRLKAKKAAFQEDVEEYDLSEPLRTYCQIVPSDPSRLKRRVQFSNQDDVYAYLHPVPNWLLQDACLFTDWELWTRMVARVDRKPDRGRLTISGFRRPDALKVFSRVTIMSALFRHTLAYNVWEQLGVVFRRSSLVSIQTARTWLGCRILRIYWVTDQGWSKRMRDRAGGIEAVFELIRRAGIIDQADSVCVVANKDDATQHSPNLVLSYFPKAEIMPHNSRGQNRFRSCHQLIHCAAALNSFTPDIRWMETVLGIDSVTQRIARTGQEIYQSLMRLSLRDPRATNDVALVVMDKDVAEWLPQWFEPITQVEVNEIDSAGVVRRKGKPGRPCIRDRPMTAAERQARHRRLRDQPSA